MGKNIGFKGPDRVSIGTLAGRVIVPFVMGNFLGVDLGVTNLATTDDGENFSGEAAEDCRRKYAQVRETCQRTGTKSAKRKIRKIRNKESRLRKDVNHCVSKRIVEKAEGTASAIAVEDLGGIGERTTVRKPQRSRMKGWAFSQLRTFITYKAALAGIPVVPVDPRDTSRTCSRCGDSREGNRRTRTISSACIVGSCYLPIGTPRRTSNTGPPSDGLLSASMTLGWIPGRDD